MHSWNYPVGVGVPCKRAGWSRITNGRKFVHGLLAWSQGRKRSFGRHNGDLELLITHMKRRKGLENHVVNQSHELLVFALWEPDIVSHCMVEEERKKKSDQTDLLACSLEAAVCTHRKC